MRSPIDGPGTFAIGAAMYELARRLGVDPLELRLRNHADVHPGDGRPWSSKKLKEAYTEGARRFGWSERPPGGTRDGRWLIGCGLADATQGPCRFPAQARVRLRADATAQVEAGYTDIGQGATTIFPQIAASVLGLAPEAVTGVSGDTDLPFAGPTYGQSTTISMGAAVQDAARNLLPKLAELAGWPSHDVHAEKGRLVRGDQARDLGELLRSSGLTEVAILFFTKKKMLLL